MREINGYKINGKLFIVPLIVSLILLSTLIYSEGFDVFSKTETYVCPETHFGNCEFDNGYVLSPGEIVIVNKQENILVEIFNYVPFILIVFAFLVNHYKYNN